MAYAKKKMMRTARGGAKAVYEALGGNTVYESLGDSSRVYQALGGQPPPMKKPTKIGSATIYSLGGASDCGADQEWDASCSYAGVTGQCVPKGTAGHAAGCTYPSGWDKAAGVIGGFLSAVTGGPKPSAPVVVQTGMSTTTKVALAGAAALGLVLILRR